MRRGTDGPPVRAHAKLNVRLRVLAREDGGYHSIETIFLRLDLADELRVDTLEEPGINLEVEGDPGVPSGPRNLCWRAAELLLREIDDAPGVRIRLRKRIPAAAGLGGGSSDAAVVLRELAARLGGPESPARLMEFAGRLGSDVPFGLCASAMALGWERGRRLLPLVPPEPRPVLILDPGRPISAADAYGWLAEDRAAGVAAPPLPALLPEPMALARWDVLASLAGNDLEEPVFRRHPDLRALRDALREAGSGITLLCGSGSCVAGVFDDERSREAAARAAVRLGTRVVRTWTVGPAPTGIA